MCLGSTEVDAQPSGERTHEVLDADLVSADEHVVVLAVEDAVATAREHGEVLAAYRSMDLIRDRLVAGSVLIAGGHRRPNPETRLVAASVQCVLASADLRPALVVNPTLFA